MLKEKLTFYKDYFETKPFEVPVFRFWTIMSGIFLPTFGILLFYVDPEAIEFISHRLIISTFWFLLFALSFKIDQVRKNLIILSYIGNMITMSWIIWIVAVNNFSPNYCIGLLLTLCMGIIFRNYKEMVFFYFIILLILSIVIYNAPFFGVNKYVFGLAVIIVLIVYLIIMFQRNYINRNLNKLNQELIEKNKQLEQFVYIASHDLKTPLRTIGSFSSLLKRRINSPDKAMLEEYTDFILKGAIKMSTSLDDLQTYSTLCNTEFEFKWTKLKENIDEIIKKVIADSNNSNVKISFSSEIPKRVFCNPKQINQVFKNLIENGIKYNRSDQKEIYINFKETKDEWCFSIKDNGIGISSKYTHKLFQVFKRLHTSEEFSGSGIGLAICKRVVENHKGVISIDSVEGKGATFNFSVSKKLL